MSREVPAVEVLVHTVALLAGLLFVFVLATRHVALPWAVAGPSMAPTLQAGDRVLVDPWSYRHRAPRVGELILFSGPAMRPERLVKRVTPSPTGGDRLPEPGPWGGLRSTAGVWVQGDNPAQSLDSRRFGPVPRERVIGRVFWRYWPLSRAGRLDEPTGFKLPVR